MHSYLEKIILRSRCRTLNRRCNKLIDKYILFVKPDESAQYPLHCTVSKTDIQISVF